jgi:hypothetical protein
METNMSPMYEQSPTRRQVIRSLMCGSLLFPGVVELLATDAIGPTDPLAAHSRICARPKRVIFLYMSGGVSHLESLIPRKNSPPTVAKSTRQNAAGSQFKFSPAGESGIPVSELFPNVASCVDDLCIIRSLTGSHFEHFQAT